jgi:hypothetical protein
LSSGSGRGSRLRLTLAVAIVVAAFTGCGGGGDQTAGSPPTKSTTAARGTTSGPTSTTAGGDDGGSGAGGQQASRLGDPRTVVEAVLTSNDAADVCGRLVTQHYLQIAYGGRPGCIGAQAPGSAADVLDLKDPRIHGDRATVVVVPSGGPYDGERVTVSAVRDGPGWAVDELEANVPVGP